MSDDSFKLRQIFSEQRTYMASCALFTPPATPTDVFSMIGSATTIVRVYKILLSTLQTTGGINTWYLIKRSTANTGGSPVVMTSVPHDSSSAAATAVLGAGYTSNPTVGTAIATLLTKRVLACAPASVIDPGDEILFDATKDPRLGPITLRGVAQALSLNFAGAALPTGLSVGISVLFTEASE